MEKIDRVHVLIERIRMESCPTEALPEVTKPELDFRSLKHFTTSFRKILKQLE